MIFMTSDFSFSRVSNKVSFSLSARSLVISFSDLLRYYLMSLISLFGICCCKLDMNSFSSGMISGILNDKSLDDSIALGMKAAVLSLQSTETVPQDLTTLLPAFERR